MDMIQRKMAVAARRGGVTSGVAAVGDAAALTRKKLDFKMKQKRYLKIKSVQKLS